LSDSASDRTDVGTALQSKIPRTDVGIALQSTTAQVTEGVIDPQSLADTVSEAVSVPPTSVSLESKFDYQAIEDILNSVQQQIYTHLSKSEQTAARVIDPGSSGEDQSKPIDESPTVVIDLVGETSGTKADPPSSHVLNESEPIRPVQVHQVRACSSFVSLKVGGRVVKARIDTGAEITILSDKIYESLKEKPAKVQVVEMQLADKDNVLKGFVTRPVQMRLGSQIFQERLYVAPISD